MKGFIAFVFFLCAGLWLVDAKDVSFQSGDVCCKVLGRSGKIRFLKAVAANKTSNSSNAQQPLDPCKGEKEITVEMDELKEQDKDGNEVGKSGKEKHSFNSFASQDFTFSNIRDEKLQNCSVKTVSFKADINGASFTVYIYIFNETCNITNGNEVIHAKRGDMKFSIEIKNWNFCGCKKGQTDEIGTQILFTLTIKGSKSTAQKKSGQKNVYALGDGDECKLSDQVKVNGTFVTMKSGFPKTVEQGGKTKFQFMFPKGSDLLYDPLMSMSDEPSTGGGGQGGEDTTAPPTTKGAATSLGSNYFVLSSIIAFLVAFFRA